MRTGLLAIAVHHAQLAQDVSYRIVDAQDRGQQAALADQEFLDHWLQVLDVLAQTTCDQHHPDLKALAARLDHLVSSLRCHLP